jgi:hypothetical protein
VAINPGLCCGIPLGFLTGARESVHNSRMATVSDFNFEGWVRTAKERIESLPKRESGEVEAEVNVTPPFDPDEINNLVSELGRPIPQGLRAFLERGSGGFVFRYKWTPSGAEAKGIKSALDEDSAWGGGEFCQAVSFSQWLSDCKEWAEDTWVADSPEDLDFWTKSFPILYMDNADFIALNERTESDDPAVVYLSHDDESKVIAPSFTAFLKEWERLHYIGPESWMLEPFLNEEGYVSGETKAAEALRQAFGEKA